VDELSATLTLSCSIDNFYEAHPIVYNHSLSICIFYCGIIRLTGGDEGDRAGDSHVVRTSEERVRSDAVSEQGAGE
jgi:hypothetical protein